MVRRRRVGGMMTEAVRRERRRRQLPSMGWRIIISFLNPSSKLKQKKI